MPPLHPCLSADGVVAQAGDKKRLREEEPGADAEKRLHIDGDSATDEQYSTILGGGQETKGGGGEKAREGEDFGDEGEEEGEHLFCLG